jgi:hypothetical protein
MHFSKISRAVLTPTAVRFISSALHELKSLELDSSLAPPLSLVVVSLLIARLLCLIAVADRFAERFSWAHSFKLVPLQAGTALFRKSTSLIALAGRCEGLAPLQFHRTAATPRPIRTRISLRALR